MNQSRSRWMVTTLVLCSLLAGDTRQQAGGQGDLTTARPDARSVSMPELDTYEFDVVTVDAKGNERSRRRGQARYFVEDLGEGVTLEMVEIPGGSFIMGSPDTEEGREPPVWRKQSNEGPQREVTVRTFFMGKFEVTQGQWRAVARMPKARRSMDPYQNVEPGTEYDKPDLPMDLIRWHDAVEFCERLSRKTKRKYRLPTEAEWEYACRAGTTTPFHFGETITADLANVGFGTYGLGPEVKSQRRLKPVGAMGVANAFGLYDMHGNVREWCLDRAHDSYKGAPRDGSARKRSIRSRQRVLRGGDYSTASKHTRSATRYFLYPQMTFSGVGFRVVMEVPRDKRQYER